MQHNSPNRKKACVPVPIPTFKVLYKRAREWSLKMDMYNQEDTSEQFDLDQLNEFINLDDDDQDNDNNSSDSSFETDSTDSDNNTDNDVTSSNFKELLNETQKVLKERNKILKENGIDRVMESFCLKEIDEKVGEWLKTNSYYMNDNYDYYIQKCYRRRNQNKINMENVNNIKKQENFNKKITKKYRKNHTNNNDHNCDSESLEYSSEESVDTAKYILSNRKLKQTNNNDKMMIKKFRIQKYLNENKMKNSKLSLISHKNPNKTPERRQRQQKQQLLKYGYHFDNGGDDDDESDDQNDEILKLRKMNNIKKLKSRINNFDIVGKRQLKKQKSRINSRYLPTIREQFELRGKYVGDSSSSSSNKDELNNIYCKKNYEAGIIRHRTRSPSFSNISSVFNPYEEARHSTGILNDNCNTSLKKKLKRLERSTKQQKQKQQFPEKTNANHTSNNHEQTEDNLIKIYSPNTTINSSIRLPSSSSSLSTSNNQYIYNNNNNNDIENATIIRNGRLILTRELLEKTIGTKYTEKFLNNKHDRDLSRFNISAGSTVMFQPPISESSNDDDNGTNSSDTDPIEKLYDRPKNGRLFEIIPAKQINTLNVSN